VKAKPTYIDWEKGIVTYSDGTRKQLGNTAYLDHIPVEVTYTEPASTIPRRLQLNVGN